MDKQEPVAQDHIRGVTKKVDMLPKAVSETSPEARPVANSTWVGLTGDEIYECWKTGNVVEAVEAKLKEKNARNFY